MAEVIKGTIMSEGVPYFKEQTNTQVLNTLKSKHLPQIQQWIIKAHKIIGVENARHSSIYKQAFAKNGMADGITSLDTIQDRSVMGSLIARGKGYTLKEQWQIEANKAMQANQINNIKNLRLSKEDSSKTMLLREGYKILSEIGEFIRGDKVFYKVVVHSKDFSKMYEYNLNLAEFLKFTESGGSGKLRLARRLYDEKTITAMAKKHGAEEWSAEDIASFQLFLAQVAGYHEYWGRKTVYPLSGVKEGYLLEAYLNSPFRARYAEESSYWKAFKPLAKSILSAKYVKAAISNPSPFWQGGEGGANLGNIQVKGNYADVTNINSLIRQMTRISQLLTNVGTKINHAIEEKTASTVTITDDEALEAIVNMFDREGWKTLSVNWTI